MRGFCRSSFGRNAADQTNKPTGLTRRTLSLLILVARSSLSNPSAYLGAMHCLQGDFLNRELYRPSAAWTLRILSRALWPKTNLLLAVLATCMEVCDFLFASPPVQKALDYHDRVPRFSLCTRPSLVRFRFFFGTVSTPSGSRSSYTDT